MLFGRPLRPEMSRRGSASPDDRKAVNTRDAWTIDLTRYGSRIAVSLLTNSAPILLLMTRLIKRPSISLCEIELCVSVPRFFVFREIGRAPRERRITSVSLCFRTVVDTSTPSSVVLQHQT